MTTMTEARKVRLTSDRSIRAVGKLKPENMRDFLLEVALLTLGATYDDVLITETCASINLEKATGVLLAKEYVEAIGGAPDFNGDVPRTELYLDSDDDSLTWVMVEEHELRRGDFTYRPSEGNVWLTASYFPVEGAWRIDMQLGYAIGEDQVETEEMRVMRLGVYEAFCKRLVPHTYAASLDLPKATVRTLSRWGYAKLYREHVDKDVVFVG